MLENQLEKIDTFLANTVERIPTGVELLDLCDALRIRVWLVGSEVHLKPAEDEDFLFCDRFAKLFRREPFRSQILAAKLTTGVT